MKLYEVEELGWYAIGHVDREFFRKNLLDYVELDLDDPSDKMIFPVDEIRHTFLRVTTNGEFYDEEVIEISEEEASSCECALAVTVSWGKED